MEKSTNMQEATLRKEKRKNEKETILPGIHDEAPPTRSTLFMQDAGGLVFRHYVPVPGIYGLE